MKAKNPDFSVETSRILKEAPFISHLGIEPVRFEPGRCETLLWLTHKHLQQDGFVHAAVQAAIADHTAGAAASTLIDKDELILTAEFKINFLRPANGEKIVCIAEVLKPGRHLVVAESEVFSKNAHERKLISKAMVTLAVVKK